VTRSVPPDVAFVTFARFNELTWHRKVLRRVRRRDNSVSAVAVPVVWRALRWRRQRCVDP